MSDWETKNLRVHGVEVSPTAFERITSALGAARIEAADNIAEKNLFCFVASLETAIQLLQAELKIRRSSNDE